MLDTGCGPSILDLGWEKLRAESMGQRAEGFNFGLQIEQIGLGNIRFRILDFRLRILGAVCGVLDPGCRMPVTGCGMRKLYGKSVRYKV